jgi:hypothetical protein
VPILSECIFRENLASVTGAGNDIAVQSSSMLYSEDSNLIDCCSESSEPHITAGSLAISLNSCVSYDISYVSIGGLDDNDCTEEYPCLTIGIIISSFPNPKIFIFSSTFSTLPSSVGDKFVILCARIIDLDPVPVNLTWISDSPANPLFTVLNGILNFENLTLIQNAVSKNSFINILGVKGKINLILCKILGSFSSSFSTSQFSFLQTSTGSVSFKSCIFENLSFSSHACLVIEGTNSSLRVDNCTFSQISSGSLRGGIISGGNSTGSIRLDGVLMYSLTLTNTNVEGGAIYLIMCLLFQ